MSRHIIDAHSPAGKAALARHRELREPPAERARIRRQETQVPKRQRTKDGRALRSDVDFGQLDSLLTSAKQARDTALDSFEAELKRERDLRAMRTNPTDRRDI